MKQVWIVNHYATDPQETASGSRHYSLARGLLEHGWSSTLLAASTEHPGGRARPGVGKRLVTDRSVNGVSFRFLRVPQYRTGVGRIVNMVIFAVALLLPSAVRGLPRPDVVVGSTVHPLAAWAASVIARRQGVPFVFEIRDLWPQTFVDMGKLSDRGVITRLLRRLERALCSRAAAVITLLPFAGEYLKGQGVAEEKVHWISNGTDIEEFDVVPPSASDEFTFMYLGSLGRANGVDAIVDGFLAAFPFDPRLRLVIIGDGTERNALQHRASASAHGARISFEPPVPKTQVPRIIGRADVLVINILDLDVYRYGVSMNKIFDYGAAARPILIASNAPNNFVREADAGIAVAANDRTGMANAMITMASDSSLEDRARWSANGRAHVEARYDYRALAGHLNVVLRDCLVA